MIREAIPAWRERLTATFADVARIRLFPGCVDAEDLADQVFVTFEGAFILPRSTQDQPLMRRQFAVLPAPPVAPTT